MTTNDITRYYTITGWIHPKGGGDDKQFYRGFAVTSSLTNGQIREQLSSVITADLKKVSSVKDDFQILETTRENYLRDFNE